MTWQLRLENLESVLVFVKHINNSYGHVKNFEQTILLSFADKNFHCQRCLKNDERRKQRSDTEMVNCEKSTRVSENSILMFRIFKYWCPLNFYNLQ